MKKYNILNMENTFTKMKKAYPNLKTDEKFGSNNKNYLYDFSELEKNIPQNIIDEIEKQAIQQTSILNCLAITDVKDTENGKHYYIYLDFDPLKANKENGKNIYSIMNIHAIKIAIYDVNMYGCSLQMPSDFKEIGIWRESTLVYIENVKFA